jgi:hypothetical protein
VTPPIGLSVGVQLGLRATLPFLIAAGASPSPAERGAFLWLFTRYLLLGGLLGALCGAAAWCPARLQCAGTVSWRHLGRMTARGADAGYCVVAAVAALLSAMLPPAPAKSGIAVYATVAVVLTTLGLRPVRWPSSATGDLPIHGSAIRQAPTAHVSTPTTSEGPPRAGTPIGTTESTAAKAAEGAQLWMQ